jgi:hypothetical protein
LPNETAFKLIDGSGWFDAPSNPSPELMDLPWPIDAEWQDQIDVLNNKLTSVVLGAEMLSDLPDERTRKWAARLVRNAWGAAEAVAELQRTLDATRPSLSTTRITQSTVRAASRRG